MYGREYWDDTPGIAVMQQVVEGSFVPPCFRLMGLRGVHVQEGEMVMAMPASGWLYDSFGLVYGGALPFLLLSAGTGTARFRSPTRSRPNRGARNQADWDSGLRRSEPELIGIASLAGVFRSRRGRRCRSNYSLRLSCGQ